MEDNKEWFRDARFGMFIHWGIYSAIGRGEWIYNRERIEPEVYRNFAEQFTAAAYQPVEWARLAKKAGMKYMVLTTKHHDGFCLWNTALTDFNSVKLGPHRDLVAEYVEAVRSEGLKVGLYYSPADWNNADYPDAYARDWPTSWTDEEKRKRFVDYYSAQLKELMTGYGKIDLLWYDGCIPGPLDGERVNNMVREYQPGILINNRNGEPFDFICCEQCINPPRDDSMWEACITLNENWGFHKGDNAWKSARDIICSLIKTAKDGGNLLLNIGPRADGTIPEQSVKLLNEVGSWMSVNGESIYASERSPFSWGTSQQLTVRGDKVFIHSYYDVDELCVAEIANKITGIRRLSDGKTMDYIQKTDGRLIIRNTALRDVVDVYECTVEGKPQALRPQTSFWIPG